MYSYSGKSKEVLRTLHPVLRHLFDEVINHIDISLIEGLRPADKQTEYYSTKKSHLQWPLSKHNRTSDAALDYIEFSIADAVDVVPYPTAYADKEQMLYTAGVIMGIAKQLKINLRWGGDWLSDGTINNKKGNFFDYWHFEIIH